MHPNISLGANFLWTQYIPFQAAIGQQDIDCIYQEENPQ